MSIIDRLPKKSVNRPSPASIPKWVADGTSTTKALYEATEQEYQRVMKLVKSDHVTGRKHSKLVLANIAKIAGKHRSILNHRRQPELCDWISRLNKELESLSQLHTSISSYRAPKSKRELEHEVAVLRSQIGKFKESERRAIVEEFFKSNLLDDRDKMARELSRIRLENTNLLEKVTSLVHLNKQLSREIAETHKLEKRKRTLPSALVIVDE